jgi:hypothetical protein
MANFPQRMISAIASVAISEDASFVATVSGNNFVGIDIPPQLELTGSWYMPSHYQNCPPMTAIAMEDCLYLSKLWEVTFDLDLERARWTVPSRASMGSHSVRVTSSSGNQVLATTG